MLRKTQVAAVVAIATAAWAIVLWARGLAITMSDLGCFSIVVSSTYGAVYLFDRFIWPCRVRGWCLFHGWLIARPDIRGTWEVELHSSWVDPETGRPAPPVRCFFGVRQTCTSLEMHLMTPESESWLQAHRFLPSSRTHGYQLAAVYTNQPDAFLRGVRSEIHHGAFLLEFQGADPSRPDSFSGEYWTDRSTKGQIKGRRIASSVVSRHADGVALGIASCGARSSRQPEHLP